MQNKPLVSVAVVTYNQKEYLIECIESILAQDYENIEIVVADDASTDGTQELLKEYDAKYPGKFVLKLAEKNRGITGNSNEAIFASNGKYFAWLGGDDLMLTGKISKQVAYMESHPDCVVSHHNLEVFESESGEILKYIIDGKKVLSGGIKEVIVYGNINGAASTMFRKEAMPPHGSDARIHIASDWLLTVETLLNSGKIHYIDEVLGKYRRHADNITNTHTDKATIDHLISCAIILGQYPRICKICFDQDVKNLIWIKKTQYKQVCFICKASWHSHKNIKSFIAIVLSLFNIKK